MKTGKWWLLLALVLAAGFLRLPPAAVEADTSLGNIPAPQESPAAVQQGPRYIALTFDDGPRRSTTTRLLDALAERGVKATFFLVGAQAEANPDVVQRMDREGHQIGIHTYDHVLLTGLNGADFAAQVERSRTLLKQILGHNDFLLRPPYGILDEGVKSRAGCPIILWSIDPEDWDDKNAERITRHIVSRAKDGDIILLHDIYSTSVEAALAVVDALHEEGFLFVTVEELAAQRHVELCEGQVYRSFYP